MTKNSLFATKLLAWFQKHGRKDLPWQIDKTPYRVWVSEIMLQQTQVTTAIPYYLTFMENFPTVEALASASLDKVLHFWSGLGYYNRARHLHRSAQLIVDAGKFPNTIDELIQLPGVGRSTAGAILAIAFKKKATILDGNVKRVLTRYLGITDWPGEKNILEKLWHHAEEFTPEKNTADYTQAIMDLGATLCVRSKPHCEQCPFNKECVASIQNIQHTIPLSKPKKSIPVRQAIFLLLKHHDEILLEKRPPTGIWSGLWSLPELSYPFSANDFNLVEKRFGCAIEDVKEIKSFRHTFSHFHLDIFPVLLTVKKRARKIMEASDQIWYNLLTPAAVGLPAPIKLLLEKIKS